MRKWIRVISALLCLCLLFGLAACGKGESSPGRSPEPKQEPGQSSGQELSTGELETRYKVDSIRLPDPIADSPQKMALYGGRLYVAGQIGDSMDVALYSKTMPDGEWQAMEVSTPSLADIAAALGEPPAPELPEELPDGELPEEAGGEGEDAPAEPDQAPGEETPPMEIISGLSAGEGGVFMLVNGYTDTASYNRLLIFDETGALRSSAILEDRYSACTALGDRVLLLSRYAPSIICSAQGETLSELSFADQPLTPVTADGALYVFTKPVVDYEAVALGAAVDETVTLNRVDMQTGQVTALCTVPDYNIYGAMSYTSESGLYLADSDGLSVLDAQTGESQRITDWLDSGLNLFWGASGLCVAASGEMYMLYSSTLYQLTAYQGPARQELSIVVGAGATGIYLDQAVSLFNMQSETHVAKVKSVSPEEMQKLIVEISTGKGPDIIGLGSSTDRESQFSRVSLNSSVCEDLIPYIEADPDYSLDSFLPGVLESRMRDGHLYVMDPGVRLLTLTVPASRANEDWSIERLLEMNGELQESNENLESFSQLFDVHYSMYLLEYFCQLSSVEYIDWAAGTCRFDTSPSFARWLELCKFYVERDALRQKEAEALGVELWDIPEEDPILDIGTVHSGQPGYVRENIFNGQDDVAYVGLPGEGENIQVLQGLDRFMMLGSSKNKEAAWEFLRTFLSFEVQTGTVPGFGCAPITKEAYDWWVEKNMASEWNDFTKEDGERIQAAIAAAKGTVSGTTVTDIILEEAQKYFDGQRTVEETAAAIQGKAKMYVAEQMN